MVSSRWRRTLGAAAWLCFVLGGTVLDTAAGSLSIAPTRLVFDGHSRVATVYLSNKGDEPATYRILLKNKRMLESGLIVDAETPLPGEQPAADLIRYSPREVVVPAHGSQTIRVMLRNPSEGQLARGEARTHLVFQSVPAVPSAAELAARQDRIVAQAIIETSIPVIIRRDNPAAAIAFGKAELDSLPDRDGKPVLQVVLERSGDRSVYGDLSVDLEAGGNSTRVAQMVGLAVYTPTPRRVIRLSLTLPAGKLPESGRLVVRFAETEIGNGDLMADTYLEFAEGSDKAR
ncbi:MAG: fimbria/pilus periplasmic chaperone [Candidatus Latescibacteria bacterium]|nr:fimbria/pilus periplasmic chaperone [Candidatus Latescibacterota bacterium]